jgi:flagellar biogenesis protein FliO
MNGYPELAVEGKTIQVLIPDSKVKTVVEKSVSFSTHKKDTLLKAYQAERKVSKIKAQFPFLVQKKKAQVALVIKDNRIELTFPRVMVKLAKKAKTAPKKKAVKKEFLNEEYLNTLLKVSDKREKKNAAQKETSQKLVQKDSVSKKSAAPKRDSSGSSLSLIEYGGKFAAFLGLVLLLFYGVVALMKKGFLKRGKLGFLNNADQISVLNQTYIAPKKSLMLIKAHNQVFLVSNTDHGIHPISEIKDAAGLLKDGEKTISGHNFDTKLSDADEDKSIETKVKLKDDITKSNQESSLSSYLNVKDKVKFSDQLKKKVKNLKPLH